MRKLPSFGVFGILALSVLLSGCAAFTHANDDNYTLCKNLEGQMMFGGRTNALTNFGGGVTAYEPAAQQNLADKRRIQATYDKLDCNKYQWFKF